MFSWLTEEPFKTIWQSLAAIAAIVGVGYAIFRRKNSEKTNIVSSYKKSTAIGKVDAMPLFQRVVDLFQRLDSTV